MLNLFVFYNLFLFTVSVYYYSVLAGLMCELLWSDPHPGLGRAPSKRGVGVAFGSDVTHRFLQENNLGTILSSFATAFLASLSDFSYFCLMSGKYKLITRYQQ